MSRIVVIQGQEYAVGTGRCARLVDGQSGRKRLCGRKVPYILPMSMVFSYFNAGTKSLSCQTHGDWIGSNEERFSTSVRFELTATGLTRIR